MSGLQDVDSLCCFPGPGLLKAGIFPDRTASFLVLLLLLAAAFALGAVWGRGGAPTPRHPRVLQVSGLRGRRRRQRSDDENDDDDYGQVWTLELVAGETATAPAPRPRREEPAPDRAGRSCDRKSPAPSPPPSPPPPPPPFVFRGIPTIPPAEQLFARRASRGEARDVSAPPVCGDRRVRGRGLVFGPAGARAGRF